MTQRGIRIDDWFSKICLGIFFFCIGMIFLSILISIDLNTLFEDPLGSLVLIIILTALMDIGLLAAISGWKGRHKVSNINPEMMATDIQAGMSADGGVVTVEQQKAVQTLSKGMSIFLVISTWFQRLIGVIAAAIGLLAAAYFWLPLISDIASGKASLKGGFFLVLGLVLVSYVIIAIFTLLRKPRAN